MNLHRLLAPVLCIGLILGLSSCASPRERRITNNPELYAKLSDSDKFLVTQGRLREGMTREGVFLAWGRADRIAEGRQKGRNLEKWTYFGSEPVITPNYSIGLGWGRGGRYGYGGLGYGAGLGYGYGGLWDPYWGGYSPSVVYLPYKAASVDFKEGRVTDYVTERQAWMD